MISETTFELVKNKYGHHASWAIWAEGGDRPKDNMWDLSIFEGAQIQNTLNLLQLEYVLVALNFSVPVIFPSPFSNFHGSNGEVYKLRYALKGTTVWGAYMTDIIKDYVDPNATNVASHLKSNPDFEKQNIKSFVAELNFIGARNPTLIALGNSVFDILDRHLNGSYKIVKIPHYAMRCNKEKYREDVVKIIKNEL